MRRIITMSLMAIGLTGGIAAADGDHGRDRDRDHVTVQVREGGNRGEAHYRDHNRRPELRVERHEQRHGFIWVGGDWQWRHGEWQWVAGHYTRR